jgi:hypothetical protein
MLKIINLETRHLKINTKIKCRPYSAKAFPDSPEYLSDLRTCSRNTFSFDISEKNCAFALVPLAVIILMFQ